MNEQEAKNAAAKRHGLGLPESYSTAEMFVALGGFEAGWQSAMDYSQSDGERCQCGKSLTVDLGEGYFECPMRVDHIGHDSKFLGIDNLATELDTLKEQLEKVEAEKNSLEIELFEIRRRCEHKRFVYNRDPQDSDAESVCTVCRMPAEAYEAIKPVQQGD